MLVQTKRKRLERAILRLGPIAYYPLNEASGTTAINNARANRGSYNGTHSNSTVGAIARLGKGANFNGINAEVQVASLTDDAALVGSNTLTLIALAQMSTDDVDAIVAMRNDDTSDGFYILKLNDTQLECRWRNSAGANVDLTPTVSGIETDWIFHTFVINGSDLAYYNNGTQNGTDGTAAGTFGDGTGRPFFIANDGNDNFGNGTIQHVALFDKALSANEVTKLARIAGLA